MGGFFALNECHVCGDTFDTPEEAAACEENHVRLDEQAVEDAEEDLRNTRLCVIDAQRRRAAS